MIEKTHKYKFSFEVFYKNEKLDNKTLTVNATDENAAIQKIEQIYQSTYEYICPKNIKRIK